MHLPIGGPYLDPGREGYIASPRAGYLLKPMCSYLRTQHIQRGRVKPDLRPQNSLVICVELTMCEIFVSEALPATDALEREGLDNFFNRCRTCFPRPRSAHRLCVFFTSQPWGKCTGRCAGFRIVLNARFADALRARSPSPLLCKVRSHPATNPAQP